jgi:nucleotide-binding universal stress UspA family protein
MSSILVGVDGSPESRRALATAAEEARLFDRLVTAMYVYRIPDADTPLIGAHAGSGGIVQQQAALVHRSLEEQAEAARRHAEGVLARVVNEVVDDADRHRITQVAIPGRPAQRLIEASLTAYLLVVGSRGRGGFSGLRLGSVSNQCLRHAACPVMIVRDQHN